MAHGIEIERKFLVDELPEGIDHWDAQHIEQGYLAVTADVEVRVRRRGEQTTLTVKSAPSLRRVEEELTIEPERFNRLWALTEGRRVVKTRHSREVEPGVVLELDVYQEALTGLMTLEVEFADADAATAFSPAPWVGAEVTGDRAFANQSLALHGRPPGH